MMNSTRLAGCCLLFAAAVCQAADLGVVTIADGGARVLRGATWYKLVEGARVQDGDVIEAAERGQVQVELNSGPVVNFAGPAGLLAVSGGAAAREGKPAATAEAYLPRGWLKFAAKKDGAPLRVRSASGAAGATDGVAVVHAETDVMEMFVESGAAKLYEPGKGGGDGVAHDLKSGDFALRAGDRPFATAEVAPPKFIAGLPRHFRVPLPALAAQYAVARVQLAADRPVSFAEAEPWLASPYRRLFIKRLQTRLSDPEFRSAAAAKAQAYPEWQAMLAPAEAAKVESVKAEPPKPEPPKPEPEKPRSIFHWPWEKKD
ncbi:MAG TPA: hypothetical protein VFR50_07870 [Casimicrobiaceae bacterium]|nr:hypothetical protein [Casimicrobiaceae bacterium]